MTIVDVFPNVIRGSLSQSEADAFAELNIPTGLSAVTTADLMQNAADERKSKGLPETIVAMELLKMRYTAPILAVDNSYSRFAMSTISSAAEGEVPTLNNRGVIDRQDEICQFVTEGLNIQPLVKTMDFTSGGVGRIVASRNLFLSMDSAGTSAIQTSQFQLFFRYVNVNFFEFYQIQEGQKDVTVG